MNKRLQTILFGFLAFNLLWWLLAVFIQSDALVSPLTVYKAMGSILQSNIWEHITASFVRVVEGILLAVLTGVPAGLLLADYPKINKICSPLLYFIYPVPKLALLPVVMLLLGIGESAKIVMIVLILVFQIIVAARDAVLHIPHEDFHVLISLGAGKKQMLRWIILPAILPEMLTSLRVTVGTAISVLFFTETFGTDKGMGFYIVDAWMRLAYTQMYAAILLLSLIGFILFFTIDIIEEKICKWKY
ncbi:MAG: ABC transporter permease [Candidatus Symbiothrix sp.]|jgi:NitT/TauT family transport system permease protein|nr:ABC transporter permease [Candidatus Symbiothrix sp.]